MRESVAWVFRVCVVLLLHGTNPLAGQQDSQQDKVGAWGSWEVWASCSRSCGGGVRERVRPCLARQLAPPRGHVVPALRPSVPLHRSPAWPQHNGTHQQQQEGWDPRHGHRIIPGRYGYGKTPYMLPLQTDMGRGLAQTRRLRQTASRHRRPAGHQRHSHGHDARLIQPARNPSPTVLGTSQPRKPTELSVSCAGTGKQRSLCNTSQCPPGTRPIREVQCSSYNNRPFMGRLYEWEPFSEGRQDQQCQLNCRAVGFRFYVRQSEKVVDGTRCGENGTAVCVDGVCQSLGCDEFLGSDAKLDLCGVCGGVNNTCRLVSGLFTRALHKVGYHKIVEIPEGATKINVTEMNKSKNYLALRSRSGRSIVNGQWSIDRPGKYEGAGTMFTYRRPNEISSTAGESLLAEGPTNEILDVFMIYQQSNPGVHYEFILPVETSKLLPDPRPSDNTVEPDEQGFREHNPKIVDNQVPERRPHPQPPRRQSEYNWKLAGFTDCSASCGRGYRHSIFHCVVRATHQLVADALCDSSTRPNSHEEPCNTQSCPAFWDIGEWSECSRTCGLGLQHRQVLCRQMYANRTLNVHMSRCKHLGRQETSSPCQLKICSEWQIRTEWSTCSVPCGVGQRTRDVLCISNEGDIVEEQECNMDLRPTSVENCDMGPCAKSWFYTEWGSRCSAECGAGMRTRGVLCLTNHVSSLPLDGCGPERPTESQACDNGPCESQTEWFTGPWSQCSAECGPGQQHRETVCLGRTGKNFSVLPPYECSSLERPPSQQPCQFKTCGIKWYHTDWSACSKTCEGGFRVREVRCLSDDLVPSETCEPRLRPNDRETCSPEPCVHHIDENCRDKHFNCNVVVQARLCVYTYYRQSCCASCTRVEQRHAGYRGHR